MKDLCKYFAIVLRHKWFVFKIGREVGGIPLWRLLIHDWSKFLPIEYRAYIKRKLHKNCPEAEWEAAYLHHTNHNPHHHEHWIREGRALPIPESYIREMVADWLAVEKTYATSQKAQVWVNGNAHKLNLHPETAKRLAEVLAEQNIKWPLPEN